MYCGRRKAAALIALLVVFGVLASVQAAGAREPALRVAENSVVRREVVALGRDIEVAGRALDTVAAIDGSVRISGSVEGDVIVLGGGVHLERRARVHGDIFVLGGRIEAGPGAVVDGRSVSYPTLSAAWLVLLEGPTLGLSSVSRLVLAAKTALLAAWLLWAVLLLTTSGRQVLETSRAVREEPFRSFMVGLSVVIALFLTAIFLSSLAAAVIGVPLLFLVIIVAVLLKLWGLVAVFHACGRLLTSLVPAGLVRSRLTPLHAVIVGLLVLGALKLVPLLGVWVWTAASLIGVGACATTKFGRREPWLEGAAAAGEATLEGVGTTP
jgi:hypothetical protein